MFVKVLIYQGFTLLCTKTVAQTGYLQTFKYKIGFLIEIHDMHIGALSFTPWVQAGSNTTRHPLFAVEDLGRT